MRRLLGKIQPLAWTYLFSAALFVSGVGLTLAVPQAVTLHTDPPGGPMVLFGVLTVAGALAERHKLHIKYHDQSFTLALSGLPMILGLLYLPVAAGTLARVLGTAFTLAWVLRMPMRKVVFNLGAIVLENATAAVILHLGSAGHHHLDVQIGVAVVLASVLSDVITAYAVTVVIFINGASVEHADLRTVLTNSVAVSAVTGTASITDAVLLSNTALGVCLTVVLIVATGYGYRSYVKIIERNEELSIVHRFVDESTGVMGRREVAGRLLSNIRTSLRAERIELTILHSVSGHRDEVAGVVGNSEAEVFTLDEQDQLVVTYGQVDLASNLRSRVYDQGRPILLARDTDQEHLRAFLVDNGLRDAAMVPFGADGQFTGTLLVANRFGDAVSFTEDDLKLLHTLTQYLAVSIRSAELFEILSYDSTHDPLTGLHNRAYLTTQLNELAAGPTEYAVFLLDLNKFKEVNDTLGHEIGDRLLITVADRLRSTVPAEAVLARLGGDEFALLLPHPAHGLTTALDLARRIFTALSEKVQFDDTMLAPMASIGVALSRPDATGSEMLRCADTAMYVAKSAEEDHVAAYHPDMDAQRLEQLQLVADLRTALETDPAQLTLHYQPKVNLHTREVTGVEALARWQHPRLGPIRPDRFIGLAETSGLIGALTDRVLSIALADCRRWRDAGHRISVAVNLSAHNIGSPTLPEVVQAALDRAGVEPESLIIEITESAIIGDPEAAVPILEQLARMGVEVSLDDFGTGYSSLSYLQRLPVAEVKIDRSFVQGLDEADTRDNARVIVSSITGLGTNLGLRVVAEGVENGERMTELRDMGCHVAQGYHIARPMPAPALTKWLADYPTRRRSVRLAAGQ